MGWPESKKTHLRETIKTVFNNVTLDDGIGLWEAQGLDAFADKKTLRSLRKKDEALGHRWEEVPFQDLANCGSSLFFFDAKGMRFYLPAFMLLDTQSADLYREFRIVSPDLVFILNFQSDLQFKQRFSLLTRAQVECVIDFLQFKMDEIVSQHEKDGEIFGATAETFSLDPAYQSLKKLLEKWEQQLK